jgi:hypothetical protein
MMNFRRPYFRATVDRSEVDVGFAGAGFHVDGKVG